MAVFRAVENRRSLVRSANTGISGFIDPAGRILASTVLFEDAILTRSVPMLQKKTFYTRFGDLFAGLCLMLTLLAAGLTSAKRLGKSGPQSKKRKFKKTSTNVIAGTIIKDVHDLPIAKGENSNPNGSSLVPGEDCGNNDPILSQGQESHLERDY